MERLTEYQWEQRQAERDAHVRFLLNAGCLAEHDRQQFEVEHECAAWEKWREIEAKRKADGWELADYGRNASMFVMAGYFKRAKAG